MNHPSDPSPIESAAERAWIAVGILLATGLTGARLGAVALGAPGADTALAHFAAGGEIWPIWIHATAFGLAASALITRVNSAPHLKRIAAGLFASALLLSVLSGWPLARPALVSQPGTTLDLANLWVQAALACSAVAALVGAGAMLRGSPRLARALGGRAALLACGGVLAVLPPACGTRSAPTMPVREVVAELLGAPERWTCAPDRAQPAWSTGILTPLVDAAHDTGDRPALILPPGGEVRFSILPEEGEVILRAAAGCDRSLQGLLPTDGTPLEVRFEVEVDGASVFDEVVRVERHETLRAQGRLAACSWRHVGGEGGLALRAGQTVTLRTSLPAPSLSAEDATDLRVGFGGVFLERWERMPRTRSSRAAPNIVLVVMDTLRADRMSCYGYERETTPHLDRLAARGMRFENAFATSSWTWPSTASILTGLMPFEHGVVANDSSTLFLGYETLAEVLQRRGYTTGAISCNPLIAPERYFDQGFETFDSASEMRMTDEVIDEALAWIDRNAPTRFFLYLHLVDPHTPHRPLPGQLERMGAVLPRRLEEVPADQVGRLMDYWAGKLLRAGTDATGESLVPADHEAFFRAQYDASVATGDHYCGLVLDALERHGLTGETIVAFTADHGEELLDHGLLAHGHSLHRELVRVPLLLAGPGIAAGVEIGRTVSNRHLAPTLATLGGGRLGAREDSLLAQSSWDETVFYATEKGAWTGRRGLRLLGLRQEGYVLHRAVAREDGGPVLPEHRLYRAEDDRTEQVDLAPLPAHAPRLASMIEALEANLQGQAARRIGGALGVGGAALEALRGIGYVGDDEDDDSERPR
ncbi:MAG: sulfatase [Planctomycetota bacterium]|jgi:arylsulfatase|nr:sulfatase [Planctomycetota bacterium]